MNVFKRHAQRGFTILLSALVASLVLALGISIFSIAQKQLVLSSLGRSTQFAFYAADSGAECALYWDLRENVFSSTTPPTEITCGGQVIPVTTNISSIYSQPSYFSEGSYGGAEGTYYTQGSYAAVNVALTSGTTWTVPANWNSGNNRISAIGGGGGGSDQGDHGSGGGGGGYSEVANMTLTPGAVLTYAIGAGGAAGGAMGGNGGDTYVCFSAANCSASGAGAFVVARGGIGGGRDYAGNYTGTGGAGGNVSPVGLGTTRYAGGIGGNGNSSQDSGGGGGGAAGPFGAGRNGGNGNATSVSGGGGAGGGGGGGGGVSTVGVAGNTTSGGRGGSNRTGTLGGTGGVSGSATGAAGSTGAGGGGGFSGGNGGAGGSGNEWTSLGAGGGGGGGGNGARGGNGGARGGGGGGGEGGAGTGAAGAIYITYTPSS